MSTKKKVVAKDGIISKDPQSKMSAAEMKKCQKMLSAIGNRKKEGAVMILTQEDGKDSVITNGICFAHQINKGALLQAIISGFHVEPIDLVEIMLADLRK